MRVSVLLPTYNERGNIGPLVEQILAALQKTNLDGLEIVVIDDNSPDGTAEAVQKQFGTDPRVRLLVRKDAKGLATAVHHGIEHSQGDVVVMMDTDFNHRPSDVPRLLESLDKHDMVIGSRFTKGGRMQYSWIRHNLSYFFNVWVRFMLSLETTDNISGFIAVKRSVLKALPLASIFSGFGEYHILFIYLAKKKGFRFCEVPVIYDDRVYGQSKFRAFENLWNYSKLVWKIKCGRFRHIA
jgi:dolichol-phosphate mannosyltransferase